MRYKPELSFPEKPKFSPDFHFQGEDISFFYTYIRKNASTSFKKLFQAMYPGVCPGELPAIGCMAKHAQVKGLLPEEIDESFALKLFIYRDPIERVFSVFKNKLIQQDGAEDLLKKLSEVVKRDVGLITFDDFVNEYVTLLETERWHEVDGHLYPQVWHLLPITYNKVIPMGSVYEEMSKILPEELCRKAFAEPANSTTRGTTLLEGCDLDTPVIYLQKKYSQNRAFPDLDSLLSPLTRSRLKEIYTDDYNMISSLENQTETEFSQREKVSHTRTDNFARLLASISRKDAENKSAQQKLEATKKQLEDEKVRAVKLQYQLESEKARADTLSGQLDASRLEQESLAEQLSSERAVVATLRHDLESEKARADSLSGQLGTSRLEKAGLSEQLQSEKAAVVELRGRLEAEQNRAGNLTDQLQTEKAVKDKLTKQLQAAQAKAQELDSQLKSKTNENTRLSSDKAALERQLAVIRASARYQLGYHTVRAAQSWRGMFTLPLAFYRVAKRRKSAKKNPPNNKAVTSEPSASTHNTSVPAPATPTASEISILGWPDYPPNGKPYVIGVMDEFTSGCFEQDLNLIQPRPDNWLALAEKYKPELIFIESAWKGNSGSWQYRVGDYANKPGQEVEQICQYAREKGIPTLFWNKEDPVHHQKFMGSARLVDHIFTTDANMKESYREKTGNSSVHALPFAAQPALHKPAPLAGRKPRACFAGSWYGNRHAERGEAMRWLLQAANRHGLDIYDRNHGSGIFPFPEEYQAGIKGSLPYKELCDEYSRYRVFLNVNSVTDSPTMFSRRVFELMACGTPVVSTYAKGIENLFESGAVWLVHSQEEADEALHTLMTDDAEWRRRSLAGIREIFARHTYAHRLNDIFDRLGIDTRMPTDPAIALVAKAQNHAELEVLNEFARKQNYGNFQLGIACSPKLAEPAASLSGNITLLSPGQQASWLTEHHAYTPLAGWLSPQVCYGEHYLRDLVNASVYEPDANGWAKAPDQDRFAYGGQASLSGALWKMSEFLKQPIKASPDKRISPPDLYLADSDQFEPAGAAQQVAGG